MTAGSNDEHSTAMRDGRAPRKALGSQILDFLLSEGRKPRSTAEIASHIDRPPRKAADALQGMLRKGALIRQAKGVYAASPNATGLEHRRPQPVRDKILSFLASSDGRPLHAKEIAGHIERSIPTTTGHLTAMKRLGQVRNPGYGLYMLPCPGPSGGAEPKPERTRLEDRILRFLHTERTLDEILGHDGCKGNSIKGALRLMIRRGTIISGNGRTYRRAEGTIEDGTSVAGEQTPDTMGTRNGNDNREMAGEAI